jgi:hypothetical protein
MSKEHKHVLLVEGKDDEHVLKRPNSLAPHHSLALAGVRQTPDGHIYSNHPTPTTSITAIIPATT